MGAQQPDWKAACLASCQQVVGVARRGLACRYLGELGATGFGNGFAHDLDSQSRTQRYP